MCGLVGVLGKYLGKGDMTFMEQALYSDALRGMHSTGMAALYQKTMKKDWESSVYKRAKAPMNYFKLDAYNGFVNELGKNNVHALMGHNRFATLGAVNDNNAHPFIDNNIILAHNGTLRFWNDLPDAKYFTVDSECIAHSMATIGVEETVAKLNGAFALSWIDLDNGTFNLVRNKERPLSLFLNKQMTRAAYGSEVKMMEWLIDRNAMHLTEQYEIEAGKWHVFDLNELNLKEFQVYDLELYKYTYYNKKETKVITKNSGGTEQSSSNFPHGGTTKRLKKKEELLGAYDLNYNQEIAFTANEFVPYDATDPKGRGRLDGYMDEEPFLWVEVHGIYPDQFTDGEYYRTNAISISSPDGYDIIMGNTITHIPDIDEMRARVEQDKEEEAKQAEVDRLFEKQEKEEHKLLDFDKGNKIYTDPSGEDCDKKDMDFFTRHGCCSCQGNISVDDYGTLEWMVNGLPMCVDCHDAWNVASSDTTGNSN